LPELPEVETIRRELEPEILGLKIVSIELLWEKTLKKISADEFNRMLGGAVIIGLERRGKYLIFKTDREGGFAVHFRMTGSIVTGSEDDDLPSYCRAVIKMDNNLNLFFTDLRKFGSIEMLESCQPALDKLGPEPLEDLFTPEVLKTVLAGRKSPVKAVLLDQQNIAGIGNMYADEALFRARINPLEPAQNLDQRQILSLHSAIQFVLRQAIERKGATVSDYTRPGGESGQAQDDFCVAHKRGCKCPRCNTPVERIVVCQRGTYLCPVCQPRN
jgi:formamidopyrimidine-DNA glycosylase